MTRAHLAVLALLLGPLGCAHDAAAPAPLRLALPAGSSAAFATTAKLVAGTYVRVVIYGETEDEGMPRLWPVSGASGVIVDPRGYIVTAGHIARRPGYLARVTTMDGRTHEGVVLDVAPERDLAVVGIGRVPGLQAARIGDSGRVRAGDAVFSIGAPENRPGVVSPGRVAVAKRAARIAYGEFGFDDAIELDMDVAPGHSGGPLFDAAGRLVGIVAGFGLGDTRRVPYVSTRIAYAIPSARIAGYLAAVLAP